jgi:hypothetical protein
VALKLEVKKIEKYGKVGHFFLLRSSTYWKFFGESRIEHAQKVPKRQNVKNDRLFTLLLGGYALGKKEPLCNTNISRGFIICNPDYVVLFV